MNTRMLCKWATLFLATTSMEEEFNRSKSAILKKTGQCDTGVQFDLDTMEGFHACKRVSHFFGHFLPLVLMCVIASGRFIGVKNACIDTSARPIQ